MEHVLIANRDKTEAKNIHSVLGQNFKISTIHTVEEFNKDVRKFNILLLDENFTKNGAIDFLTKVLINNPAPVLMLSSKDTKSNYPEAISAGAYNYIVKSSNYIQILDFAISDSIRGFKEKTDIKNQNLILKKRIVELESGHDKNNNRVNASKRLIKNKSLVEKQTKIVFDDIIFALKSQEIELPLYPKICTEYKNILRTNSSNKDIVKLLSENIDLTSKIISVSNSPYYEGMKSIESLDDAVNRIGVSEIGNFVEVITNQALYEGVNQKYSDYLKRLWKHSLACAFACQEISKTLLLKNPKELFLYGLFHDFGKLILVRILSDLENKKPYDFEINEEIWKSIIKSHHGQFGSFLMKKWRFPKEFSNAMSFHANPELSKNNHQELWMLNLANQITLLMGLGEQNEQAQEIGKLKAIDELKITLPQISIIEEAISAQMEVAAYL